MITFLIFIVLFSLAIQLLEPIAIILGGLFQFIKNNWYFFILIAYFFRP